MNIGCERHGGNMRALCLHRQLLGEDFESTNAILIKGIDYAKFIFKHTYAQLQTIIIIVYETQF